MLLEKNGAKAVTLFKTAADFMFSVKFFIQELSISLVGCLGRVSLLNNFLTRNSIRQLLVFQYILTVSYVLSYI